MQGDQQPSRGQVTLGEDRRTRGSASMAGTTRAHLARKRLTCPTGYSLPPSANGCLEREKATTGFRATVSSVGQLPCLSPGDGQRPLQP